MRLALEPGEEIQGDRLVQWRIGQTLDQEQIELLRFAGMRDEVLHVFVEVVRQCAAKYQTVIWEVNI